MFYNVLTCFKPRVWLFGSLFMLFFVFFAWMLFWWLLSWSGMYFFLLGCFLFFSSGSVLGFVCLLSSWGAFTHFFSKPTPFGNDNPNRKYFGKGLASQRGEDVFLKNQGTQGTRSMLDLCKFYVFFFASSLKGFEMFFSRVSARNTLWKVILYFVRLLHEIQNWLL